MKRRVLFVGIHNKPGLKPLDSKSKSGKLIDRIMERCAGCPVMFQKVNLYDMDYLPLTNDRQSFVDEFPYRVDLSSEDVVVLLGDMVHREFPDVPVYRKIKIAHPSSKKSHESMDEYVNKAAELIKAIK